MPENIEGIPADEEWEDIDEAEDDLAEPESDDEGVDMRLPEGETDE